MAILNIYSVKDSKIGVFGRPICEANDVLATRALQVAVNDPLIQLSHFPEDFDLFKLGTFEEETGKIEAIQPVFIVGALSLKRLSSEMERIVSKEYEESMLLKTERGKNENRKSVRAPSR